VRDSTVFRLGFTTGEQWGGPWWDLDRGIWAANKGLNGEDPRRRWGRECWARTRSCFAKREKHSASHQVNALSMEKIYFHGNI
jgi:hypothetical protein